METKFDAPKPFEARRRRGSLTIQIALSIAAFILTIEAVAMYRAVHDEREHLTMLREAIYGKVIHKNVVVPTDILSEDEIDVQLSHQRKEFFFATFVLLVVVVGGSVFIIHRRAIRPIHRILAHDDDSRHGRIRFIPEEDYPPNEVGQLMHSRNLMLYSLLQAYKKEAIDSLVAAVDAKDKYTYGHSKRVGYYAALLARAMGMSQEEQENLRQAGDLHDIGKIAIPEEILTAPRALSAAEWEVMKKHPRRGEAMLRFTTFPDEVRLGTLTHHENHDGTGYPDKLKGDRIPLVGRILHVADALDAMTTTRPYRKPMTMDMVIDEFVRCRGKMFDPKSVDALLGLIERDKIKVPHFEFPDSAFESA